MYSPPSSRSSNTNPSYTIKWTRPKRKVRVSQYNHPSLVSNQVNPRGGRFNKKSPCLGREKCRTQFLTEEVLGDEGVGHCPSVQGGVWTGTNGGRKIDQATTTEDSRGWRDLTEVPEDSSRLTTHHEFQVHSWENPPLICLSLWQNKT